ncbi:MAG: peroxiredoxin [Verrucomicrobiota bacterium JB022]|nr:peroxiredoxin [Verrucomicrobiota bacterium JB022]
MITVGQKFPEFRVQACVGLDNKDIETISHESFAGKWKVYFFYPKDFTFVCPTELVEFNKALEDFEDRDAVVIGGSTDNEFSHLAWRKSHDDLRGLNFPLIAAAKLARELGIVEETEGVCYRATFIVDPHGVVQHVSVYNLNVGRNVKEIVRVLDAIQSDELCPCNWQKGEDTLKAG